VTLSDFYRNKRIFITGHSGFKGAWLYFFLKQLGSHLSGYSLEPDDNQKILYNSFNSNINFNDQFNDIRDIRKLRDAIKNFQPQIIFHLAAQPLVLESHYNPLKTFSTNIIGTANLIEASRNIESVKSIIIITSDKCYENLNDKREYVETDRLGGIDPYSASKSCAEIITRSYQKCFFINNRIGLTSARAGNVIGGGDFSADRLIPDIVRSIINNETLSIRNPNATRPWQHVFDVIYGYLLLARKNYDEPQKFSDSFNFSPSVESCISVKKLLEKMSKVRSVDYIFKENDLYESNFLSLNSDKAKQELGWKNIYNVDETIKVAYEWYNCFIDDKNIYNMSLMQFNKYMELANEKN
tara:strand:- start:292 stop:1356 length:1065 start_codon:yes stop_codon:yes gene_type:complete